jgi:hypothetical protein
MTLYKEIGIYDVENPIVRETTFPELGSSIITEPNIIPINNASNPPNLNNDINAGNTSSGAIPIQVTTPVNASNTSAGSTSGSTSNSTSEPSATTDETKTYIGGGTTPDSNIVVKKPTSKYFIYGIIGIIGALVVYKVFFNKKT